MNRILLCVASAACLSACGNPSPDGEKSNDTDATAAPVEVKSPPPAALPTPTPSPSSSPTPLGVTRAFVEGVWVFEEDGCATDNSTRYNADGTWYDAGESGTWELIGNRLTATATERFTMGEDTPPERVDPPEVQIMTITPTGAHTAIFKGAGGSANLRRCA